MGALCCRRPAEAPTMAALSVYGTSLAGCWLISWRLYQHRVGKVVPSVHHLKQTSLVVVPGELARASLASRLSRRNGLSRCGDVAEPLRPTHPIHRHVPLAEWSALPIVSAPVFDDL